MGPLAEKKDELFTYGDYLKWGDDERWELIDGVAYNLSPAPSPFHQHLSAAFIYQFYGLLKNTPCNVYPAPFDVRLPEGEESDNEVKTVVQPDISIVCDPSKIDNKGCAGAPDLIVEILSPATARKDVKEKFALYEKAGVREYWIVDPAGKIVSVFKRLDGGLFGRPDVYGAEEKIKVGIFEDLEIDLQPVFGEELPVPRPHPGPPLEGEGT